MALRATGVGDVEEAGERGAVYSAVLPISQHHLTRIVGSEWFETDECRRGIWCCDIEERFFEIEKASAGFWRVVVSDRWSIACEVRMLGFGNNLRPVLLRSQQVIQSSGKS